MSSNGQKRVDEYFTTKIASAISMTANAIAQSIRFDYILCESWFTCLELIRFVKTRRITCHLLGMVKNGTAKYTFNGKELTTKEMARQLAKKGLLKRSKLLGYYYSSAIVMHKGFEIKLFFAKNSKRGNYNVLLSTNLELNFQQAYRIYANRWSIEFFSEKANNTCKWADANHRISTHKSPPQRFVCYNTTCLPSHVVFLLIRPTANCFETLHLKGYSTINSNRAYMADNHRVIG